MGRSPADFEPLSTKHQVAFSYIYNYLDRLTVRAHAALLGDFGHSFRLKTAANFRRISSCCSVKQVTGILPYAQTISNLIENQCSSTPLHCISRRQDAALAFSLCASRVIVMCDSPSASSSFRIEVARSGREAAIVLIRPMSQASSNRRSVANLFQSRSLIFRSRYSPPIFMASFAFCRLMVW